MARSPSGPSHTTLVSDEIAHVRTILLDRTTRRDGTEEQPLLTDEELLRFFKRSLSSILDRNTGWFDGSDDNPALTETEKQACINGMTVDSIMPLNNKYLLDFERGLLQWINLQNTPTVRAETYLPPTTVGLTPRQTTPMAEAG